MGSTFYQSEITQIWHKNDSFWASFEERDGTTDIQDLSRQADCWDREVNEQLQSELDKVVELSLTQLKLGRNHNSPYELELRKYILGRILHGHRFSQEHLQTVISELVCYDTSKSAQQNLTERFASTSIEKLQEILKKLQELQRKRSRVLGVFNFSEEWCIVVREMGLSTLQKVDKWSALAIKNNIAAITHNFDPKHAFMQILKAQLLQKSLMLDSSLSAHADKAETLIGQALTQITNQDLQNRKEALADCQEQLLQLWRDLQGHLSITSPV